MSYAPCKNQHCRSYGDPHPNCKCYGGMAGGGDVAYCSGPHEEGCQYYQDGGDVLPEGLSAEAPAVTPSTAPAAPAATDLPEGLAEEPPKSAAPNTGMPEGLASEEPKPQVGTGKLSEGEEQFMAATEGALRGIVPGAPVLAKHNPLVSSEFDPDLSYEAQYQRAQNFPITAKGAEMAATVGTALLGTGVAGGITRGAEALTGSKILQGVMQGGLLSTNDEVSNWIMGHGPAEDPVGSLMTIGLSGLFGGLMGGASSLASTAAKGGLTKLAEEKFGQKASSFLEGLAAAAKNPGQEGRNAAVGLAKISEGINLNSFKAGMKMFDGLIPASSGTFGAVRGWHEGEDISDHIKGALKGFVEGTAIGYGGKKLLAMAGEKYIAPAVLKILSSERFMGATDALDHAAKIAAGNQALDSSIENMLKGGPVMSQQAINAYGSKDLHKDIDEYLDGGGITKNIQEELYRQNTDPNMPHMAKGGEVTAPKQKLSAVPVLDHETGVGIHYPEQNLLLNAARGRVSNYLNSLKPRTMPSPHLFDDPPDTRDQEKQYRKAVAIAAKPLGILHEAQRGTLEPEHVQHFNAMYPELSGLMQKKLTKKLLEAKVNGDKPPYKLRQSLSMLMGSELSSELSPQMIQAAQSAFAPKAKPPEKGEDQQGKEPSAPKKSKSLDKSSQSFLTDDQARSARLQAR